MISKRRSKDDPDWIRVKKIVSERDRGCRLMRICTPQEYYILIRNAGSRASHCDPAHVFDVSSHPHMCYDENNIVQLNRFSHDCLDNCKNPISGSFISIEERDAWWERIVGSALYAKLRSIAYPRGEIEMDEKKMEESKVVLDNNAITASELAEQKKRKDQRIVENGDGSFKTLKKLSE